MRYLETLKKVNSESRLHIAAPPYTNIMTRKTYDEMVARMNAPILDAARAGYLQYMGEGEYKLTKKGWDALVDAGELIQYVDHETFDRAVWPEMPSKNS